MGTFLLMFILLMFFLALGIPVAFSITATSLVVLASIREIENLPLEMIAQRMLYGVNNFTLLAIPSFLLIGKLMNAAGITDRMFNVARAMFGHFRGGLGHVNIIAGSSLYSWVLARYQVTHSFIYFLTVNVKSPIILLLLINVFLLLIGCFIDSVPALFLLTPILVPLVITYGIDPVHFGVVVILNLMIGLISPPVGTVLYTLQKVTGVQMDKLFKNILPFYVPLFAVLLSITYVPWLVTFIPNIFLK